MACSGQTTRTMASEAGSSRAAPVPVTTRAAISTPMLGANAQATEAAARIAVPIWKVRLRP